MASIAETFNLEEVITGLASDLKERRAGKITVEDARARADLARQIFNGLRLFVTAQKYLEQNMKQVKLITESKRK
jgi:hypothetical protein